MAYLFRQKLQIEELADTGFKKSRVLVYEPEVDMGALHAHYLRMHNFDVLHCPELSKLKHLVSEFRPRLLIFSTEGEFSPSSFIRLRSSFPELQGVSLGFNTSSEGVGELMRAGVSSHINRKLSRPEDLPILVKAILSYSGSTTEAYRT